MLSMAPCTKRPSLLGYRADGEVQLQPAGSWGCIVMPSSCRQRTAREDGLVPSGLRLRACVPAGTLVCHVLPVRCAGNDVSIRRLALPCANVGNSRWRYSFSWRGHWPCPPPPCNLYFGGASCVHSTTEAAGNDLDSRAVSKLHVTRARAQR